MYSILNGYKTLDWRRELILSAVVLRLRNILLSDEEIDGIHTIGIALPPFSKRFTEVRFEQKR